MGRPKNGHSPRTDYEKIAMVGDKKWQNWITQFMKPFTNADIKYFNIDQKEDAKNWIESQ